MLDTNIITIIKIIGILTVLLFVVWILRVDKKSVVKKQNIPIATLDMPIDGEISQFLETYGIRESTCNYRKSQEGFDANINICPECKERLNPPLDHGMGSECRYCGTIRATWGTIVYYLKKKPTKEDICLFSKKRDENKKLMERYKL